MSIHKWRWHSSKEQLAALQRMTFGESSERRPDSEKLTADEPKKAGRGHGPKPQPNLPIEEVPTL
jgi:transposase